MPTRISLFAIDVDGTLVADDDRVLPTTRAAVQRARRHGLPVVLATGRRYRTTRGAMEQLSLTLPVVCLGGALAKSEAGRTIYSEPFTPGQVEQLLAFGRRRGQSLVLQRDADGRGGPDFVVDAGMPWNEPTRYYADIGGDSGRADPRPERSGRDDVLVVGAFGDRDDLRALQNDINDCGDYATVLVKSRRTPGWYLETILGHVDKWFGIRRFAAWSGLDATAICAVGDAANDLPMIRGAAFGVAMGNADASVKQAADWTTGSNREDGVATLVDLILSPGSV